MLLLQFLSDLFVKEELWLKKVLLVFSLDVYTFLGMGMLLMVFLVCRLILYKN